MAFHAGRSRSSKGAGRPTGVLAAVALVAGTVAGLSDGGAGAGCSLLLDLGATQCQSDADRARFPQATCDMSTHLCREGRQRLDDVRAL